MLWFILVKFPLPFSTFISIIYKLCSSSRRLVPLFVWGRLHTGASQEKRKKNLARSFNFTFRYIDDVLSLNNSWFGDFVDRIYPIELEVKDTTDTDRSASYLDLHLEIDSERRLRTKLYDKRDDFKLPIVNFPFICNNIPAAPAYGVYISLSWYDILELVVPTRISLIEGYWWQGSYCTKGSSWLSWSHHFESFTFATMTWLTAIVYLCHKWPRICCTSEFPVLSSFMTYHRVCNQINTTGATSGAGTAYPSAAPQLTPGF